MPTPINPNQPPGQPGQGQYDYSAYTGDAAQTVAQESYRIKDGGGGADIFIPEIVGDFPRFGPSAPQQGSRSYLFDIVMAPAGFKHPVVVKGKIPPDAMVHIFWVYIHKGLGQGWWVCPSRTYGKRCPACEVRTKIMSRVDYQDEAVKKLREPYDTGQHATGVYDVIVHNDPRNITWQEPVMYWQISNYFMESILQGKAKSDGMMEGTGYINYYYPTAGPQGGRHIKFDCWKKGQYDDFGGHTFFPRQAPVPPHVLAQARCLSDFVYIGQANRDRVLAGQEGPPTQEEWDAYYDELKAVVDVVVEGQQQAPAPGQPTGEGYAVGYGGPAAPAQPPHGTMGYGQPAQQQVFGSPGPQLPYQECAPLGSQYGGFGECATCTIRVECGQAAPPPAQDFSPPPSQPEPQPAAPAPAQPQPMPQPGPQPAAPAPAQPKPMAPMPRRPSQ